MRRPGKLGTAVALTAAALLSGCASRPIRSERVDPNDIHPEKACPQNPDSREERSDAMGKAFDQGMGYDCGEGREAIVISSGPLTKGCYEVIIKCRDKVVTAFNPN